MNHHERDDDLGKKIGALPHSIEPRQDMWGAVSSRIEAKKRRDRRARGAFGGVSVLLAAAAIALVIRHQEHPVAVATGPAGSAARLQASPSASVPLVANPLLPEEASYEAAIASIAPLFDARKGELPAHDVQLVTKSLAAVDAAITTTTSALAQAPADDDLRQELDAEYEQKIQILNDVLDWTTRS